MQYFFGSFYSREEAYNMITSITANHPNNIIIAKEPENKLNPRDRKNSYKSLTDLPHPLLPKSRNGSISRSRSVGDSDNIRVKFLEEHPDLGLAESLYDNNMDSPASTRSKTHIIHQKFEARVPKGDAFLERPLIPQKPKPSPRITPANPDVELYIGRNEPIPPPVGCIPLVDIELSMPIAHLFDLLFGCESAASKFSRNFWVNVQKFKGKFYYKTQIFTIQPGFHLLTKYLAKYLTFRNPSPQPSTIT